MEKAIAEKQKKKWPFWAGWLLGYAGVLAGSAGLVYYWRVAFYLTGVPQLPFTLGVAGVATAVYLAVFLIVHFGRGRLVLQATLFTFLLGLLFCFATAPLQAPDEEKHFTRAYAISAGNFDYDYSRGYPDDVNLLLEKFPGKYNHGVQYADRELAPTAFAEYRAAVSSGETPKTQAREPIAWAVVPYLHQALFMLVARLFGGGALACLYAGRIANLLLYTLMCALAYKNCSKYRGVFFAVCMLPLSLFMAASCNTDALMLAASFLAVSYFCKKEIHSRDVVVFGLAVAVATYLKPMAAVLVVILLLVPKARWKTKFHPWIAAGIILVAAIALYQGFGVLNTARAHNYPAVLPRGDGEGADTMGQISFMLRNPLRLAAVLLLTFIEEAGFLFNLGTFGWLDLAIPFVGGLSLLSLVSSSALGIQQKDDTKTTGALALLLAALLYGGAVMVGLYVAETHLESIRVSGLQPRYFLPAFLLLFMLASILLGKAVRPRLAPGGLEAVRTQKITMCIAVVVAVIALVLIFQYTYIGQWIPKGEGGHKLVNLLGWQKV